MLSLVLGRVLCRFVSLSKGVLSGYHSGMEQVETRSIEHRDFAVLSAELIENAGALRFRARGQSMAPSICDGDILTLEKADTADLRIGDVVLVKASDELLIAHRIIEHTGDSWTTCGDARAVADAAFAADQLIGRVRSIERGQARIGMNPITARLWAAAARLTPSLPGRVLRRILRMRV